MRLFRILSALAALYAALALGGCASTPRTAGAPADNDALGGRQADTGAVRDPTRAARAPELVSPAPGKTGADEVVLRALALLGTPYRYGGATPSAGFDCSGLVNYVFRDTHGIVLPRTAEELGRVGYSVSAAGLQPGDLLFFNTQRRPFSHVGIYMGRSRFIHAPSSGGVVRVESLQGSYWRTRFDGARRLSI